MYQLLQFTEHVLVGPD
ncbi:hypothetical protein BpHYR1_043159 [Brachionus plicatilis]|uniref:Uncharacterized protein n=1 Tax=Brachionus plicatilis TaxID=10195 RepID=A0A3M7PWL9_BRAPC|nr:hypothetical protein BpHYR1_043159 [Brachionus plicatilis]